MRPFIYRGKYFEVRPKRWWLRKERKAARLAAKLANSEEFLREKVQPRLPFTMPLTEEEIKRYEKTLKRVGWGSKVLRWGDRL